jgi:hypothetical protein
MLVEETNQAIKDTTVPTFFLQDFLFWHLKIMKESMAVFPVSVYIHSTNSYEMLQKHSD